MAYLFYLVGPLLLVSGIIMFIERRKFAKDSSVINGVIAEIKTGPASRNRTAYYPVIRYSDVLSSTEEVYESNTAYEKSRFKIGDNVELRYLNDGVKKKLCLNNWAGIWGLSTMLILSGLIFCAIDYVFLFLVK